MAMAKMACDRELWMFIRVAPTDPVDDVVQLPSTSPYRVLEWLDFLGVFLDNYEDASCVELGFTGFACLLFLLPMIIIRSISSALLTT